jgi:two-component system phosphate regulon sensor histidine kinase PhoR
MQTEAQRMARLVNDLMSLSRVEINEHVAPREAVDMGEVIEGASSALAIRAAARGMTIEINRVSPLPPVAGDFDQLTQVMHNLIDNALKYARENTAIRISVNAVPRLPGDGRRGVIVSVIDSGDGISTIHLPRLTERFYRVDQGRSRRLGGTGLGLAIVKHIIRRHRGRLSIDSKEGIGTTVTICLPAAAESELLTIADATESETSAAPADVTKP